MRYSCFLLECKEDEERQADFQRKEASSPILVTMASFTNDTILIYVHFVHKKNQYSLLCN